MDRKSKRVSMLLTWVDYNAVYSVPHLFYGDEMQYSERLRNYELEKSRLLKSNKPMSSAEYEAFIRALADKWGI